jgi:peptide/nickel transport system substrate-binding protein
MLNCNLTKLEHSDVSSREAKINSSTVIGSDLAKDWSVPDETTYEFELVEDAVFHNGNPIDSEVVKWNFNKLNQTDDFAMSGKMEPIDNIKTPSANKVIIELDEPFAPFLTFLNKTSRTGLLDPIEYEEVGPEEYATNPVGGGPFKIGERQPGEYLRLERFEDYYNTHEGNQLPYLDEVEIRLLPEVETLWNGVVSGDIDFASSLDPEYAERLEGNSNVRLSNWETTQYNNIAMLANNPNADETTRERAKIASGYDEITTKWDDRDLPTSDVRVRRAIAKAIDREALVERAYFGNAIPLRNLWASHITTGVYEHLGGQEPEPGQYFDLEGARELLDEAGYPRPDNGDPRFSLEFLASPNYGGEREATVLQEQLMENVGIQLEINFLPSGEYFDEIYRYRHAIMQYGGNRNLDQYDFHWRQLMIPTGEQQRGIFQKNMWFNEEWVNLAEDDVATVPNEDRLPIIENMAEIYVEEAPFASTVEPQNPRVEVNELERTFTPFGTAKFEQAYFK